MSSQQDEAAAAGCPVDHKAREAWLQQARAAGNPQPNPHASAPPPAAPTQLQASAAAAAAAATTSSPVQQSCDSSTLDQSTTSPAPTTTGLLFNLRLGTDREISTIPRSVPNAPLDRPANNEKDTGADKASGNWIYPSERMFFDAMRRKSFDPEAQDMKTIVPIHNAVNERAWHEIKAWEKGRGSESCGGPKLESFSGLSTSLTPRARWNALLGYQAPFDRHDWVVDRCGTKVEYVIDFYAGKTQPGAQPGQGLNFYLDVRPKLNSWEGVKTRVSRFWGF
ncbi:cytochrome c1 heme lyase [Macroventuria anomochaeta]|uniref:Cytochrome c1 heme lyase n=1 Tax=Macroventuria anomochaeta TaxID=301207 RepID=A0ACB6RMV7_9PLEO|nr:cytochrome c1 heme lyase [Macroventuria anomochaeta]KAF2622282.1 cytochrome c1 heme lyase [Macroventuria anomochaeta]